MADPLELRSSVSADPAAVDEATVVAEASAVGEATAVANPTAIDLDTEAGKQELPGSAGHDIQREVERAFERFFKSSWLRPFHWDFPALRESFDARTPRINLIDQTERLVLEAELPGVKKSELRVMVTADRISVRVERADAGDTAADEAAGDFLRREISHSFSARTITLPTPVAADAATALFADGLLTVFLPKALATEGRRVAIE